MTGYVPEFTTSAASIPETIGRMTRWLKAREPFLHARFNDGEWNAMFRLRSPDQMTSDEHHYSESICRALKETFEEIMKAVVKDPGHILVGSVHELFPYINAAKVFKKYIDHFPDFLQRVQWVAGDAWYSTDDEAAGDVSDKGLFDLFAELRSKNHPVVFVSNSIVQDARYCLGADYNVVVPLPDSWSASDTVLQQCREYAKKESVFVWCAGFPSKVWSWTLWKDFPGTSHLDLGHVFDGVFGKYNRGWLDRKDQGAHRAHWDYLHNTFKPYVLGYIR